MVFSFNVLDSKRVNTHHQHYNQLVIERIICVNLPHIEFGHHGWFQWNVWILIYMYNLNALENHFGWSIAFSLKYLKVMSRITCYFVNFIKLQILNYIVSVTSVAIWSFFFVFGIPKIVSNQVWQFSWRIWGPRYWCLLTFFIRSKDH